MPENKFILSWRTHVGRYHIIQFYRWDVKETIFFLCFDFRIRIVYIRGKRFVHIIFCEFGIREKFLANFGGFEAEILLNKIRYWCIYKWMLPHLYHLFYVIYVLMAWQKNFNYYNQTHLKYVENSIAPELNTNRKKNSVDWMRVNSDIHIHSQRHLRSQPPSHTFVKITVLKCLRINTIICLLFNGACFSG